MDFITSHLFTSSLVATLILALGAWIGWAGHAANESRQAVDLLRNSLQRSRQDWLQSDWNNFLEEAERTSEYLGTAAWQAWKEFGIYEVEPYLLRWDAKAGQFVQARP